ncbi:hypothetical protein ACFE04_027336 [Oxalis oulophora]
MDTTELCRNMSGNLNSSNIVGYITEKICSNKKGRQVPKIEAIGPNPLGGFLLMETLTRNNSVTRKPGSKNPKERTTLILQRLACSSDVKEEEKILRYRLRKNGIRMSSLRAQDETKVTRRKRTVQRVLKFLR